MKNFFRELYKYRELLKTTIKKEIRGKYKGSVLGVVWSFLNPLLQVTVYAFVFPYILKVKEANYLVFLIVGLLPWTFFTTSLLQGASTNIVNGNIIKKVYFPREILPISVVTGALINFLISCIIILIIVLISGLGVSYYIVFLPVVILIQYILCLGLALFISAITVYLRDIEHLISIFVMVLFYGTPIVYSIHNIPAGLANVLYLNPMSSVIEAYRDIFYYKQMPNMINLGILSGIVLVGFILFYLIFKKLEKGFAEEL